MTSETYVCKKYCCGVYNDNIKVWRFGDIINEQKNLFNSFFNSLNSVAVKDQLLGCVQNLREI